MNKLQTKNSLLVRPKNQNQQRVANTPNRRTAWVCLFMLCTVVLQKFKGNEIKKRKAQHNQRTKPASNSRNQRATSSRRKKVFYNSQFFPRLQLLIVIAGKFLMPLWKYSV